MEKFDYKKQLKRLYQPSKKTVEIIDVPRMNFLMIDGEGNPNTSKSFQDAMDVLYPVSYTIKFKLKKDETVPDYTVAPLEGLWWCDNMSEFSLKDKDNWKWTVMVMQPDFVDKSIVEDAIDDVRKKKNPTSLDKLRFEEYAEGLSAQTMHIGPYDAEEPTVQKIHDFIRESGYELRGSHHEIYLGDPRRAAPEKLRTVIRQPVVAK